MRIRGLTAAPLYSLLKPVATFAMAVLLTGGTGKTSSRIAKMLRERDIPLLLASRNPTSSAYPCVKFDWTDSTTWSDAFSKQTCKAVYMMEPQVAQPWIPMIRFVDFAISKGVKRFVLCAGTTAQPGKDGMGRVWDAFVKRKLEFCVLRPSWFMGESCCGPAQEAPPLVCRPSH